ncbi:MAG: helix-hairpin-helix domain-containing protein [Planctomycetaceae bacterium]|nr:helix-hairpin-helix domain-containing protein [Planctomycetaceae bacterium]
MWVYLEECFASLQKRLSDGSYFGGYRSLFYAMLVLSMIPFLGAFIAWFSAAEVKNKQRYRLLAIFFLALGFIGLVSLTWGEVDMENRTITYGIWTNYFLLSIFLLNYLLIFLLRKEIVNEPPAAREFTANPKDEMDAKARIEVAKARQKINAARTPLNVIIKEQEQIVSYGDIYGIQSTVLNINSATQGQIEALPRVGKTLALLIVQNRQTFGEFASLDELCTRCSIKPHIRIAMEPLISFSAVVEVAVKQKRRGRVID